MGMLSTVINAIALQDAIEKLGIILPRDVRDRDAPGRRALHPPPRHPSPGEGPHRHLRRRHRKPFFSTDTAASLRAMEIKADILLKATSVDGIYTADPKNDSDATKLPSRSPTPTSSASNLGVMDTAAVSLCKDNNMPMMVFSMRDAGQHRPGGQRREARLPRHRLNHKNPSGDHELLCVRTGCPARQIL